MRANIRPPNPLDTFFSGPFRAAATLMLSIIVDAPLLRESPQGHGRGVLILPGFLSNDSFSSHMSSALTAKGFKPRGAGIKIINTGYSLTNFYEGLAEVFDRMIEESEGMKPVVVGHSLGGLITSAIVRDPKLAPRIARGISVAGPTSHVADPNGTVFGLLATHRLFNGTEVERTIAELLNAPRLVPFSSIYTPTDGIVSPETCMEGADEHICVPTSSHVGMLHDRRTLYAVMNRAAQNEGCHEPFIPEQHPEFLKHPVLGKASAALESILSRQKIFGSPSMSLPGLNS